MSNGCEVMCIFHDDTYCAAHFLNFTAYFGYFDQSKSPSNNK